MARRALGVSLVGLLVLLPSPSTAQDEGWSLDLQRKPSGETTVSAQIPHLPFGAVVNVTLFRIVDKPNLVTRSLQPFHLEPPSSRLTSVARDGQTRRIAFVLPAPGTYEVKFSFEKALPHPGPVATLLEKGKIEPWSASRRWLAGDAKEHLAAVEAAEPSVRRLISKIEAILAKLDRPVSSEQDPFHDAREADSIVQEAEKLIPQTGLPGTMEFVRILADMIRNYISYSPKQLDRTNMHDDGHEEQLRSGGQHLPPPAPGEGPPVPPSGDGVETKHAMSAPAERGPGSGAREPSSQPQHHEPSAFVKRIQALLEELRWFHLRETALILMRRTESILETALASRGGSGSADLLREISLIDRLDEAYHDNKETLGQKYRAITGLNDKVKLRKILSTAAAALVPREGKPELDAAVLQECLRGLTELDPHVRRFFGTSSGNNPGK